MKMKLLWTVLGVVWGLTACAALTAMLPTRDLSEYPEVGPGERSGQWETVFTNRDALHAAISEDDGKTWIGFRGLSYLHLQTLAEEMDTKGTYFRSFAKQAF